MNTMITFHQWFRSAACRRHSGGISHRHGPKAHPNFYRELAVKYSAMVVLILGCAGSAQAAEFYAAPNGSSAGTGSIGSPWDLQTALNGPANVQPGDTIWLRGGTYRISNRPTKFVSRLAGAVNQPI